MAGHTPLPGMLTAFFRQDRPIAYFPLFFLVLLLWPGAGTGGQGLLPPESALAGQAVRGMPFHAPIGHLAASSPWASWLLGVLFTVALAHGLNRMANDAELYERRNHLPAVLLPLLLALLPFGLMADPAMLGMLIVTWALGRIWAAVGKANIRSPLFDAGLLLGLASLFYLPYAFLTVVLWATLAVTRPFNLREYVLPVVGLAAMLLLGWGVVHFAAPGQWQPVASLHFPADAATPAEGHWMYRVILLSLLGLLSVAVILSFSSVYAHSVMREKNIRASFLSFAFALGLLALFAWWLDGRVPPVLLAAPGCVLLGYPLMRAKKGAWADAALWMLLLLSFWARWAG